MIISASYKTDIPAFYGEWFINRLRAGYCKVRNPYNNKASRVSLDPTEVDGIVFWTKNVGPFLPKLKFVRSEGFPFVIQYTINGYPRELESRVLDPKTSIDHIKGIADKFGNRAIVWRYDTILFSSLTPYDFHKKNFEFLSRCLSKTVDEVVVSFAQFYKKTYRNLQISSKENGFSWNDPGDQEKIRLARELSQIALSNNIRLTMCSQPQYLIPGVGEARCIDINRFSEIAGKQINAVLKGNRVGCGCYFSKDIGDYDTCPHGCVYCYAVQNRETALSRYKSHDPMNEFLLNYVNPPNGNDQEDDLPQQLNLFK